MKPLDGGPFPKTIPQLQSITYDTLVFISTSTAYITFPVLFAVVVVVIVAVVVVGIILSNRKLNIENLI